jgi:hypothetical protein
MNFGSQVNILVQGGKMLNIAILQLVMIQLPYDSRVEICKTTGARQGGSSLTCLCTQEP